CALHPGGAMPTTHPFCKALLLSVGLVFAACSSSSSDGGGGGGGGDVAFHAEAPALPGFSHDTGLQPAGSPAQVSLTLTAGGPISVDAVGTNAGGKLQGKAGASKLKLDVHVKLAGHLKVNIAPVNYDGDLPGLSNIDIPIAGETPFDGFLLTGSPAQVAANIPETKLPDIPLGSVPGHLELTVGAGSQMTASFKGSCLSVKGGKATWQGQTTTSGKINLKASLVLDIPLHKQTVPLPDIPVDLPQSVKPLASADTPAPGYG